MCAGHEHEAGDQKMVIECKRFRDPTQSHQRKADCVRQTEILIGVARQNALRDALQIPVRKDPLHAASLAKRLQEA